jgi:hypothetical protein
MEPYRIAGLRCPQCPESPLREFQDRLVCDECQGMLIGHADFATACADLDGRAIELAFSGDKPSLTHTCPKCERHMTLCRVHLKPTKTTADVMRCDRDGIWCQNGFLEVVFANLSRSRPGHPGYNYARTLPNGPDGLPVPQLRAGTGLRISEWGDRPRHRKPTLTPINAYADRDLACPVCTTSELVFFGDRYACGGCGGTFVQNAAFEAMVMDVAKELFQLPAATGAPGPRACPVCKEAMLVDDVEQVPIDRCQQHGLWFDPNELAITLERASGQFEKGWRAWLKRLLPH